MGGGLLGMVRVGVLGVHPAAGERPGAAEGAGHRPLEEQDLEPGLRIPHHDDGGRAPHDR